MKQRRRAAGALARWAADALLSACVVAPLVVGHWRGCWLLLEHYGASAWGAFAGGAVGHAAVVLARDCLQRLSPGGGARAGPYERLRFLVARRLYTALFGLACIAHWHGGWAVLDAFPRAKPWVVGASGVALLATRTLRNTLAPPYVVIADHANCAFLFPTMFRVDRNRSTRHTYLYVLDCLFSVLVVGTLVVFVWRGVWTLLDLYLYPEQPPESSWASLALGYAIVGVTFALQPLLKRVCSRLGGLCRLIVADVYLFFAFLGTVNLWRGFWNLLNEYFLVEQPLLSFWVTHVVCLLLLMLLNCSNSILVRGVYIDAEEEGGKCVDFPTHYLRLFVKERRGLAAEFAAEEQLERILPLKGATTVTVIPAAPGAPPAPVPSAGNGTRAAAGDRLSAPPGSVTLHPPTLPSNHLPLAALLAPPERAQRRQSAL